MTAKMSMNTSSEASSIPFWHLGKSRPEMRMQNPWLLLCCYFKAPHQQISLMEVNLQSEELGSQHSQA